MTGAPKRANLSHWFGPRHSVEGHATRLTLRATAGGSGEKAARALTGMKQGWSETLDRLGERAQTRN